MRALQFGLLLYAAAIASAASPPKFFWLSDLHFDPTANPELVNKLANASVERWREILSSPPKPKFSTFGQDTTWPLLASLLQNAREKASDTAFTVVTGDILVHRFREKFNSATSDHDDASFERFAAKTVEFIVTELGAMSPGKPVFLTLGNNDDVCGDYQLQPGGPFLRDSLDSVRKALGSSADQDLTADWTSLGNYSARLPQAKRVRLISLNSTYFSPRYRDACGAAPADPGEKQLEWLRKQLARAKENDERVWLIFHIPPGVDGYATALQQKSGNAGTIFLWKPTFTSQFEVLLKEYRHTVTAAFAGHEHMDDFRTANGLMILLTPGVSPLVGQNPAFRVVSFRRDGSVTNEQTFYLSNLEAAQSGAGAPAWKLEYDFAQSWNLKNLQSRNVQRLYKEIESQPASRQRWSEFYSVSHTEGDQPFAFEFCAAEFSDEQRFRGCVDRFQLAASH